MVGPRTTDDRPTDASGVRRYLMKYFSRWSGIVGGVALGRVMKQYPGVAEAIARALGETLTGAPDDGRLTAGAVV